MEKIKELHSKLEELKKTFQDPDFPILQLAEEIDSRMLNEVARLLSRFVEEINYAEEHIEAWFGKLQLENDSIQNLEATAALANEFDASGDPFLKQQAQILDKALFVLAESSSELTAEQKKYRDRNFNDAYNLPREELAKSFRIAETKKALENAKPKVYRPNEASLSTRHCPDHPGVAFLRVADYVYQCSLDHKIYDFKDGFSTLKGNAVPGGSVSNQWNDTNAHHAGQMGFETRESKTKG